MGVTIRSLIESDLDDYERLFTPHVRAALHVSSSGAERIYITERIAQHETGTTFLFGVFCDDELIGALEIRAATTSRGQLYCWLNEQFWGNGYFRTALELAASFYFQHSNERYITAHVDCDNLRSYRALKKAGFADAGFQNGPHGRQYELIYRRKI
jgi:RimJ/RimL family protein N-acetyltransferase